jgi:hypothetical protein
MKVNKMPFLVSIGRGALKFGGYSGMAQRMQRPYYYEVHQGHSQDLCETWFYFGIIEVDGQFEPLRGELAGWASPE